MSSSAAPAVEEGRATSPVATSPPATTAAPAATSSTAPAAASAEPMPAEGALDVDNNTDVDSAFGDDSQSETTSIGSSMYAGYFENGRRYQNLTGDNRYWGPADENQFESLEAGHLLYLIMDSQEKNNLFRSPISDKAQNVIDLGTGDGAWAIDVADKFPHLTVRGVDLYPPPATWVPPNAIFEVDDFLQEWTWSVKFDLVHLRLMLGSMTPDETQSVYERCYKNMVPGGWIESLESDINVKSDDGSLDPNSQLAAWGGLLTGCAKVSGRSLLSPAERRAMLEKAGFINIQEKEYKLPLGGWPKHPTYKDAGHVNLQQWRSGLEGWGMWMLTKFAQPTPWSPDEVRVLVAKLKRELDNPKLHAYHLSSRIWGQKPFETKQEEQVQVEDPAATA